MKKYKCTSFQYLNVFILCGSILLAGPLRAQEPSQNTHPQWYHTVIVGYEGVHQTGPFVHLNTVYKGRYGIEAGYGSDFLSSTTLTGKYYLNRGLNQFYAGLGYGYFSSGQQGNDLFAINTAHVVLGYQSIIGRHWVIGTEVSMVKYLNQHFKLQNITYSETYNLNENNYFEVGISIGYRFNFAKQLRKESIIR